MGKNQQAPEIIVEEKAGLFAAMKGSVDALIRDCRTLDCVEERLSGKSSPLPPGYHCERDKGRLWITNNASVPVAVIALP